MSLINILVRPNVALLVEQLHALRHQLRAARVVRGPQLVVAGIAVTTAVETRHGTSPHATFLRLKPDTASATPLPYLLVTAQLFDFRQCGTGAVKHLLDHDLTDDVVDLASGEVELRG